MALKDDMNMLGRSQEAADSLGRVGTKPIGNPVGMEQAQSTVLGYAPTQLERADNGGVQAVGTGASGTVGAASSGAEGAGTDGQVKVPTQEDLRIKGYMGAFSDLVPKASYADDVKRQEKLALFNLLANMGKVAMQSVASKTYGERKFNPIQDNSAKIQENIERFKALQRAADDKRNGTLLSLAIQQRDKDDAAKRADAQMQMQKERADEQMKFQREQALAHNEATKWNQQMQERQFDASEEQRDWARQNAEKEREDRNRQWGAEFGLRKKQWEYNTQPVLAFSTKFGDLYVKNQNDVDGIVRSFIGRLSESGDKTATSLFEEIKNGNNTRSNKAYSQSLEYLNSVLEKNPNALMYLIRTVENEGGELRQSDYQKNALRHHEYNLQWEYNHGEDNNGDASNNTTRPSKPIQTGTSGRNGVANTSNSGGASVGNGKKKPNPMDNGGKKPNPMD